MEATVTKLRGRRDEAAVAEAADKEGRYEKLYRMLIDAIPSSVILVDRHLRVVSANHNFLEKAQRQERDTIGQPIDAVFPPLILEQMDLTGRIWNTFERCETSRGNRMTYRAPGLGTRVYYYSLIPFSWQGVVEHVMLLMEDVTEQVRLGEEARRAERHLASVVESARDLVFSATLDGSILTWNTAAEQISGYSLGELRNQSFLALCSERHRASVRAAFDRIAHGEDFGAAEWELATKTGAVVPVSFVGAAMKDDLDRAVAIVAVGRDLSEHRRLEAQLLQSQKLAALGVLAGGVAHEIRNPLCASSSAAQFLLEEPDDPEFRRECAGKILEGIRRASVVIEDLLRFAHPGARPDMVPLDLRNVVREVATLAGHQASVQRVTIQVEVPRSPLLVRGVSGLLQQVFMNLILNALAAMPDGGKLVVRADGEGAEALVRFSDNGRGIAPEEIDKIFDPFFTTMSVGKGTGLGLSICYSIVRQHLGVIEVDSAVGIGSTFTVRLPMLGLDASHGA